MNTGNNWGWVPGPITIRPVYAPALVVFIGGPRFSLSVSVGGGGGNVGWFPLGPREVYVPAYQTSRAYVDRVNVSNTTVNNVTITNVYNNTNNKNIQYSNRNVRGGVTAVTQNTFVNAQPVSRSAVIVNSQEIASAPISRRAEVVPTRNSVIGSSAARGNGGSRVAQPSAAVANRAVVAKTPPPSAPVPFERQQARLAAQPGQPLGRNEVEVLRSANVPSPRARVKQAPPGKPASADSNQPVSRPANVVPASGPVNNVPSERGGNHGQQPSSNTRPPAATPASILAAPNPPMSNAPTERGGNRGPQRGNGQMPDTAKAPAAPDRPASNAPTERGGNRGSQRGNEQTPDTAKAPSTPNPPPNNAPAERGGNRGQQRGNAQTPESVQTTPVPSPASRNAPADRSENRGQ